MAQCDGSIAFRGKLIGQPLSSKLCVQSGHCVFILEPLSCSQGIQIGEADFACVMVQAALPGIIRHGVFFFPEIRDFPYEIHIVKKARLLPQKNPAESGCCLAHSAGMYIGFRHEAYQEPFQESAVGHTVFRFHEYQHQLPQGEEKRLVL